MINKMSLIGGSVFKQNKAKSLLLEGGRDPPVFKGK